MSFLDIYLIGSFCSVITYGIFMLIYLKIGGVERYSHICEIHKSKPKLVNATFVMFCLATSWLVCGFLLISLVVIIAKALYLFIRIRIFFWKLKRDIAREVRIIKKIMEEHDD